MLWIARSEDNSEDKSEDKSGDKSDDKSDDKSEDKSEDTGCPKKNYLYAHFWVSELGRGVFRGKWTLLYSKYYNFLAFSWLWQFQNLKNNFRIQNI